MVAAQSEMIGRATCKRRTTLGQLIERFKDTPKHTKRKKTLLYKYDFLFRLLSDVIGDEKPVSEIVREDCREVFDLLQRLPANAKKKFPSLTFRQIVDHVATLPEGKRPSLLNGKTLSSHVYRMTSFFTFAEAEDYIQKHPAKRFELEKHNHSRNDKSPFTAKQLEKIFNAPLYTGKVDPDTGQCVDYESWPRSSGQVSRFYK